MTVEGWTLTSKPPGWLIQLEPATTGMLGQEGLKLWTAGDTVALGIRAGGVVYPVFSQPWSGDPGARTILGQVTQSWCLMGPTDWVRQAEPWMPPSVVHHRVEYEFLVRYRDDLDVPPGPGIPRVAGPGDANALFSLQEGYEKEEVLFRPEDFQTLASRMNLGRTLRTQQVVALWENGKPVAKAGTNALTETWAQIGGVFTRPDHRGLGCQKRLMAFLLRHLNDQNRNACLFVKKANPSARSLYLGLGFASQGDFLITYGERR